MKKVVLQEHVFYYDDKMTYFYDKRHNNVLFVKIFNKNNGIINYDGAQLIINFNEKSLTFRSLWNVNITQTDDKNYLIEPKNK